jgi:hypothetical protein
MRLQKGILHFQLSDDAFSHEEKRAAEEGASGTIMKALARQLDASLEWPRDEPATLVRITMPVREIS